MRLSGTFGSQLKYWTAHALFCATPSFIFALGGGYDSFSAVSAMLAAIAVFIFLYAYISSRRVFNDRIKSSALGHAIALGAKLRSLIAGCGLAGFFFGGFFPFSRFPFFLTLPDMYCGAAAINIVEYFAGKTFYQLGSQNGFETFYTTFFITAVDGVLLSGTLVALIFLCLIGATLHAKFKRVPVSA
jgi:hypothetical protein